MPPRALDQSIQGTRREATQDWIIQGNRHRDRIIHGCHGEAKAVRRETSTAWSTGLEHEGLPWRSKGCGEANVVEKEMNAAPSTGLEHRGHTGRSNLGLDHIRKQGPGPDHPGLPWRSKGRAKGDHCRRGPRSGPSRAHGQKQPKIGSAREAEPKNGSSWIAQEKQRPRGRRPTPPGARDWNVQGSRAQDCNIQGCHEGGGEEDQRCPDPWIGASMVHGEKRTTIGSYTQAGGQD